MLCTDIISLNIVIVIVIIIKHRYNFYSFLSRLGIFVTSFACVSLVPSIDLHSCVCNLFVSLYRILCDVFPNLSKSGRNVEEGHEANAERVGEVRRVYTETD